MNSVRDKTAQLIERIAKSAFKDHQITRFEPLGEPGISQHGWWKVQKPGTWTYGYYVANMPGMVHVTA